jgi:pimeloyl-ACP methyl ester carboxylesterase
MKAMFTYKEINIPLVGVNLTGRLRQSENQKGLVVFSHGSGSSRLSGRNNYVAEQLLNERFSSLLFDLLTEQEDVNYENRFDIELLTRRLVEVTQWIIESKDLDHGPIGYFGASTGAASALKAAAEFGDLVKAVVSRGGRPDLAIPILHKVKAPTLLIVGGDDIPVIELNKKAYDVLGGIKKMEVVPGATHLFPEPGKLEEVARLSCFWFDEYLKIK